MQREAWFDHICRQTIEMVPRKHRAFLDRVDALDVAQGPHGLRVLATAALVAVICERYRTSYSPNEIAAELLAAGLHPDGADTKDLLDELIHPVLDAFRRGRVPIELWWEPAQLSLIVLPRFARARAEDVGEERTRRELVELWGASDAIARCYIEEGDLSEPSIPSLLAAPEPNSELHQLSAAEPLRSAIADALATIPQRHRVNDAVAGFAEARARYRTFCAHLGHLHGLRPEFESELAAAGEQLGRAIGRFTAYEVAMLNDPDEDEELLRAAVDARRNVIVASDVGSNAMADSYLDRLLVPDWLTDYCVAVGGRIGRRSCGPVPYWFLVVEGPELPDEIVNGELDRGISFGHYSNSPWLAEFAIVTHTRGEPRGADVVFSAGRLDDIMQLALIAVTGRIRLDAFVLSPDGLLELVASTEVRIADTAIAEPIRMAALKGLRAYAPDPDTLLQAWFADIAQDQGFSGFQASDWAKSEELAGLGITLDEVPDAKPEEVQAYVAARDRWLMLHDKRARFSSRFKDAGQVDAEIEHALGDYRFARANVGPRHDEDPDGNGVASLVEGLVDSTHAFIHINRVGPYLDAFIAWMDVGELRVDRIDISAIATREVEAALNTPSEDEVDALRSVVAVMGPDLGRAVVETLSGTTVRHLYVSPVGFLHAFPMALLALGDGSSIGDHFSISYTPSARILQRLRGQAEMTQRDAVVAVAFHEEDDIPLTTAEVSVVKELYSNVIGLEGPAATPDAVLEQCSSARLLHLACHGSWRRGDSYASGLTLAGEHVDDGYLSVARLHRDAALEGADIVVLSACDSGRATSRWPAVENYSGIDGAFLARGARVVVSSLWEVDDLAGLLFTTALHIELAAGADPLAAFAAGVDLLRSGRYLSLDGTPMADLLDRHAARWREEVDEVGDLFCDPFYWSVFKLSGLVRRAGD